VAIVEGRRVIAAPSSASWKNARSVISVRTTPGQTALTRRLLFAEMMTLVDDFDPAFAIVEPRRPR
jgi:hypothetical protein